MPDPRRIRFERLTLHLDKDLYHAALAMAGDETDAMDLVLETYLRAYRAFHTYRTDENIKGWLFIILRNAYMDLCRKRRLQPVFHDHLDDSPAPPAESGPLEELLPDDLARALNALSRPHRLLVLLADVERLSYKEIAEITDRPIGSVMSGLHNARNRLRAQLERAKAAKP